MPLDRTNHDNCRARAQIARFTCLLLLHTTTAACIVDDALVIDVGTDTGIVSGPDDVPNDVPDEAGTPQSGPFGGPSVPEPSDALDPSYFDGFEPAPSRQTECVAWRRVVSLEIDMDEDCPSVVGWEASRVFGPYCTYEWNQAPQWPTNDAVFALDHALGGVASESDCLIRTQGRERMSPGGFAKLHSDDFGDRSGRIDAEELALAYGADPEQRVLIAAIDNAGRNPARGTDLHGKTVVEILRDIAVGRAPGFDGGRYDDGADICQRWDDWAQWSGSSRRVESFQALLRDAELAYDPDAAVLGFRSDLGRALAQVVECWQALPDTKLVVNLSVGWEPSVDIDGGIGEQLVVDALLDARCRGALVFAAAGNREALACVGGPVGPAHRAELDIAPLCEQRGFGRVTGQLLEPVSGVDRSRRLLSNHRPGGDAAWRAAADNAIGQLGSELGHASLSGSSMATSVVSGIAGLLWSVHPELGSDELVALMYASGEPLNASRPADIGAGAGDMPRMMVVRDVLSRACTSSGAVCRPLAPRPPADTQAWLADYFDCVTELTVLAGEAYPAPEAGHSPWSVAISHVCGSPDAVWELWAWGAGSPPYSLEQRLPSPWVTPQPRDWSCSNCVILGAAASGAQTPAAYLIVTDSETLEPADITFVDIYVYNAAGDVEQRRYRDLPLSKQAVYIQPDEGLCEVAGSLAVSAFVSMTFDDGVNVRTLGNPVPIVCP